MARPIPNGKHYPQVGLFLVWAVISLGHFSSCVPLWPCSCHPAGGSRATLVPVPMPCLIAARRTQIQAWHLLAEGARECGAQKGASLSL